MKDLWGISGPEYLALHVGLLGIVLLARVLAPALSRLGRASAVAQPEATLSVYQLACLAGGPDRVVDAAIAALVERGELRVSSTKKITSTTGTVPADPIERVVAEAARTAKSTATIRARARITEPIRTMTADLEQRGLLQPVSRIKTLRLAIQLFAVAVLVLAIVRFVAGIGAGHSVGYLAFLIIVTIFIVVVTAGDRRKAGARLPTAAGNTVLGRANAEHRHGAPSPGAVPTGVVLAGAAAAVALGGLAMYPDEELRAALMPPVTSGFGGGGSSGGSSCSSGSSCSGGSSCGGGGGCGGGGCGG
ncbi:TIGR04222 domain-containing membrane protein [Amycolatopsis sp. NPDC059021]|uniref:TIGR04222 domain-containing membrane protein n=1 Tax=Amycolatopsis sp. NPDC059021 TaxID=3346704 RepID=UPI00366F48E5